MALLAFGKVVENGSKIRRLILPLLFFSTIKPKRLTNGSRCTGCV